MKMLTNMVAKGNTITVYYEKFQSTRAKVASVDLSYGATFLLQMPRINCLKIWRTL